VRKWANLARVEADMLCRRVAAGGFPYLLIIDPCNYCNLRCPLCPTGRGTLGRPQKMMSFDTFRALFDPLAPYLFETSLHNWGESLLNKQVYRMIAHAQSLDVGTNLSTNFSETTSSDLDNLLDCGLEYLIVSLDGTSAATYSKYRVCGRFDNVIENMNEILRRRRARRVKTPVVEWQFIVMQTNEHEVDEAERLAGKIGVDRLRFIPVGLPCEAENKDALAAEWLPVSFGAKKTSGGTETDAPTPRKGACFYLYRSIVINSDGGLSPCCIVHNRAADFGALLVGSISEGWNNLHYRSARSLFSEEVVDGAVPTVCDGCSLFRKLNKSR
jgi:MoaA/NifB/PqqE/SkfB family radical SAM enzyme